MQKTIIIEIVPKPEGGERVNIQHTNVAGHEVIGIGEIVKELGRAMVTSGKDSASITTVSASQEAHKMD